MPLWLEQVCQYRAKLISRKAENLFFKGTGGTLAGCATYLRESDPAIKIVLADPQGSGLFNKVNIISSL